MKKILVIIILIGGLFACQEKEELCIECLDEFEVTHEIVRGGSSPCCTNPIHSAEVTTYVDQLACYENRYSHKLFAINSDGERIYGQENDESWISLGPSEKEYLSQGEPFTSTWEIPHQWWCDYAGVEIAVFCDQDWRSNGIQGTSIRSYQYFFQ